MQDDRPGTGSTLFESTALVLKMACRHGKAKVVQACFHVCMLLLRVLTEDEQGGAAQRVSEAGPVDD
jgi:hypothetical protein